MSKKRKPYNDKGEKECPSCKEYKHLDSFGKNSRSWDEKMTYCRDCWSVRASKTKGIPPDKRTRKVEHKVRLELAEKGLKRCSHCHSILALSAYNKDSSRPDGLNARCKNCIKQERYQSYEKNKTRYKRERRGLHLRKKYGISLDRYEEMLVDQNGKCGICNSDSQNFHYGILAVDHCHQTGKVRALLCNSCNVMLGNAKDDPAILRRAADYIERNVE